MGQTANLGLPFPDGGEVAGASAISNLANALDSYLNDLESTQNPTMITLECINGWESVIAPNVSPLRLYRMGQLVVMHGEVIRYGPTSGTPITGNNRTFTIIPAGWRPANRIRQWCVRSSADGWQTELYIDQYNDGEAYLVEPKNLTGTPGYSISATWIME